MDGIDCHGSMGTVNVGLFVIVSAVALESADCFFIQSADAWMVLTVMDQWVPSTWVYS